MSTEEMRQFLVKAQQQTIENKMLSAILTCYQSIKNLEDQVIDTQKKVNQIIRQLNPITEGAATVNQEEDAIVNDIAAAEEIIDE